MRKLRNDGRTLVVIIESVDKADLSMLATLASTTKAWVEEQGIDTTAWPPTDHSLVSWFDNPSGDTTVHLRADDAGYVQRFLLWHGQDHDVLVGVGSRRTRNRLGDRAENVATNLLLDLVAPKDPRTQLAPYGTLLTLEDDRVWRTQTGAAHIQETLADWDVVLRSTRTSFDPREPGASLLGSVSAAVATMSTSRLLATGSRHRVSAHTSGQSKFPREKTHPAILIDQHSGQMSYAPDVVDALRRAASLRLKGWTWEQVAKKVAGLIPSYVLRGEPDHHPTRRTTRSARNTERERQGLPTVPLKYLSDGTTPNPAYRPEVLADLADPASSLRKLFSGPTLPRAVAQDISERVGHDLEGIHPASVYLMFFETGVYRRLVKDHDASNRVISRYRWIETNLGPVDDGFILSPKTASRLRALAQETSKPRGATRMPLSGLFDVVCATPLLSEHGPLKPDGGKFVWRTSHNSDTSAYRIYYEPHGATPHGADCVVVGYVHATEVADALGSAIVAALSGTTETLTVTPPPSTDRHTREHRRAEEDLQQAQEAFDAATDSLADRHLTERQRARLRATANEREQQLVEAEQYLEQLVAEQRGTTRQHQDVEAQIGSLVDVLAAISNPGRLEEPVARACQQILKAALRCPTLTFEPAHGRLRLQAVLEWSTTSDTTLRVPVDGYVRNRATDTWIAGLGGRFLARRIPLSELWDEMGLQTSYKLGHHWRAKVAEGLLTMSVATPLAGPGTASLLVRCPDARIIDAAVRIMLDEDRSHCDPVLLSEVHQLLFTDDVSGSRLWTGPVCRRAIEAARR